MASQPSNADLHIIYNFFEEIQKPPEQESFLDGMRFIFTNYVGRMPSFILGQLHQNLDPNGMYPFVNHATYSNADFHAFRQGKPPEKWITVASKGLGPRGTQKSYPGGYKELGTLSGEPLCTKKPKENSSYLLVNYKEAEVGESNFATFEADWKVKSGATILSESLPADMKQGDVALYKRLLPGPGMTPFLYVLRCEILPGSSTDKVLEFLPTLRTKLTEGGVPFSNVSAYKVSHTFEPITE